MLSLKVCPGFFRTVVVRPSEFDVDEAEMGATGGRQRHDDDATEAFDGIAEEIKKA